MGTIGRREFLRVSALAAAATLAACATPPPAASPAGGGEPVAPAPSAPEALPAAPGRYTEAPALADKVAAGELPPVDERLPIEPLVLDPVESIGKYGGNWKFMHISSTLGNWSITHYCENFAKWQRDPSLGHRPNVLTSWAFNDDATEITLYFRKGIRWSDGEPLTVDDWLFWWYDMALDDNVAVTRQSGQFVNDVNMEVERIDDYTVRLSFVAPNPLFIEVMSRGTGNRASSWQIVPAHYLKQFHPKYNTSLAATDTEGLIDRYNNRGNYLDMPHFGPWVIVEFRPGERIRGERNPYYWKVDPEGKQLPYIDTAEAIAVANTELITLSAVNGELDMQMRNFALKDVPVLMDNQDKGNYDVMMWKAGNCNTAAILPHYCYEDESITSLFWEQKFRQALSYAINRQRINDVVFMGLGTLQQFVMFDDGPEYRSERGQKVLADWKAQCIEYLPDKAMELLDEIGVVDVNGDDFREKPDGSQLQLVIDVAVTAPEQVESMQLVQEDLQAIGIDFVLNTIDSTLLDQRVTECASMMRARNGAASGLFIAQGHWTPVENTGYTIFGTPYGVWYQTKGAQGVPPPEGSAIERLQQIYTEAIVILDAEERNNRILDGYQIHIDEGPFMIGTVGNTMGPVVVKRGLKNVPDYGLIESHVYGYPGTADPEQWYWE
jgi:peptide/nickel transport system substrate-binding protein